jgi:hypothetical protein
VISADNQQERLKNLGWIVGFVDGEGCFSVAIHKNSTMTLGWQVFPEFVITQGEKSKNSLVLVKDFFGCGNIFVNNRKDNHRENLYRYCVRSVNDLNETIIPFFQANQLKTSKRYDFEKFTEIVGMINNKNHLTMDGLKSIARLIETMNRKVPSKFLESSETIRRTCSNKA